MRAEHGLMIEVVVVMLFVVGCGNTPGAGLDNDSMKQPIDDAPTMITGDESITESAIFLQFPDLTPVPDSTGMLTRFADRIEWMLEAHGLEPGHVYTIWYDLINDPSQCTGTPCTGDDFGNPATMSSAFAPVGAVADDTGTAIFETTTRVNDQDLVAFGPGLTDPTNAELALIIRTHGPEIPETLEAQLTTLDGGCPPNTCMDLQLIVFEH